MIKVLIIGDIMLDHYLFGECCRISPEAPVPIVNIKKEEWRLGGAANVANNLVALNTNPTLIGIYGNDAGGDQLKLLLSNNKLRKDRLYKSNNRLTIVKSRVLVGSHQMIRLDKENISLLSNEEEKEVLDIFFEEVENADAVLVSDYNKGLLTESLLKSVFESCSRLNIPSILDPKSNDFSKYKGATFIKPNRKEAEQAAGIKIQDKRSLQIASETIKKITCAKAVITTLSEDGMGLYMNDQLSIIPTKAQKVFDVTGAGDTCLAAFAYEYMLTNDANLACEFANDAAAVVVAKVGSATASIEEIDRIRNGVYNYESNNLQTGS